MRRVALVLFTGFLATGAVAQKRPLTHADYDGWQSILRPVISRDGQWVAYDVSPQEGDSALVVYRVGQGEALRLDRPGPFAFSADSKYLIVTQVPKFLDVRDARRKRTPAAEMPKNNLVIVDLATRQPAVLERVTSFSLAQDDAGWVLYKPEPPPPARPATPPPTTPPPATPPAAPPKPAEADAKRPAKKTDHRPGETWVARQLSSGAEEKLEDAVSPTWSRNGRALAYGVSTKDGADDGVVVLDVSSRKREQVAKGLGRYRIAIDNEAKRVAFLTDRDDYTAKLPAQKLFVYERGNAKVTEITPPKVEGLVLSTNGNPRWSEKGTRLVFPMGDPPPEPVEVPEDERVTLDVWHWQDNVLMPQQLLQANTERNRTYDAVWEPATGLIRPLESREFPQAVITEKGDGRFAILETNLPYRRAASWDALYEDFDALDIKSGERRRLLTKFRGDTQAGPAGLRLAVLDAATRTLAVDNLATGKRTSIAMEGLSDEQNDVPDLPSFYGVAGWTKDDAELLIYDRFDIWLVDTEARRAPVRLTNGRPTSTQYRVIRIDPDADFLDPNDLLLTSVDERTRDEAIVRRTGNRLTTLWAGAARHQWVGKAKNADTVVMRRATLQESPNLWLTTLAFTSPSKITSLNPQQAQVNWLTVELIEWTSADGERLSGMIFKPENFDYAKKYPMITYFYERLSDTFHAYRSPAPSASTVNIPYFCSNGYVVFVPDIPYKIGYPGESAVSAIVPGVHAVLDRGYVDPKRLGIQGQSWGGYQTVYVISETNLFAAAEAGAPVSNMFSAYGGIRYGSGLVRQFQYERGQSRIDGTPWNSTLRYIENSPIFFADKIRTPLMIMHNDKDGAVPWTQSIELFTALRRLEKPVWLINYNDEDHNLVQRKNRKDLSIRLAQFFDHYLKGAPMPEWMAKGLPAVDKGRTMGLELVKPGN